MMQQLWSTHPDDLALLNTEELRERFLVTDLFQPGEVRLAYAHDDRLLIGGIAPDGGSLRLEAPEEIRAQFFFERREGALVGLAGAVEVDVDGERFRLGHHDVLYVPLGSRDVTITGQGQVYLVSAPAHRRCQLALASRDEVEALHLGEPEAANVRTIRKYVHADGVESNQLVLGITTLAAGSVWNTMPAHLHGRRTEIYLYTGLGDGVLVHLMGQPDATRHLILRDGEAVVSPPWSIHSGSATGAYSFVWAMAGENVDYTDVEAVSAPDLR